MGRDVDLSEFEAGMAEPDAPAKRRRRPEGQVGLNLESGEATFDARPDEQPGEALERLVRELWPDVDAPTLSILRVSEVTFWGDPDRPQKRFKAKVSLPAETGGADLAELQRRIYKRRPRKPAAVDTARTLVTAIADPQVGKASRHRGTPDVVDLWNDKIGKVEDRLRDLKRLGRPASRIYAPGVGDTTEGCLGNYASQLFTTDLNEAEQIEVATSMLDKAFDSWSGKVDELLSTTVSSNHDAKRAGKDYPTGRSDCRARTIWRSLARAYSKNEERYGHVKFWLPDDPDVASVDLHGHGVGSIHGDLPKKGTGIRDKMWNWWQGQTMGNLPAGDCDVLLTAHYHHFWSALQCDKWLFGCPALDAVGSQWLTDSTGVWSSPGLLTLVVDEDGVSDVEVL